MEKKQLLSVVKPLIAAALLFGSSGGVAWGQTEIGNPGNNVGVTTTDGTNGTNAVNNVFGAGESALISAGRITFPRNNVPINTSPQPLIVGEISGSPSNIVVNSYNGGGQIQGWVVEFIYTWRNDANRCGSYPNQPAISGSWSPADPNNSDAGTDIGSALRTTSSPPGWGVNTLSYNHNQTHSISSNLTQVHETGSTSATVNDGSALKWNHSFGSWWRFSPYATNVSGLTAQDDNIHLVQVNGSAIHSLASYGTRDNPKTPGNGLELYRRPTTVGVSGLNQFENLFVYDLPWYYRTYAVTTYTKSPDVSESASYDHITRSSSHNCGHLGNQYTYYRQHGGVTVLHRTFDVTWNNVSGPIRAMNGSDPLRLDAAIAILSGADVCVEKDIEDKSTNPQSNTGYSGTTVTDASAGGFTETDALLVLPKNGNNFRLKVGRDFKKMNMYQDNLSGNPPYYTATSYPKNTAIQNSTVGTPASTPSGLSGGSIFLYKNTQTDPAIFDVVDLTNLYAANLSETPQDTRYSDIQLPYSQTRSGVFGVYKSYSNSNARIHTGDAAGMNNPGVIEIGPATVGDAATKGWNRFFIYSGGTIKNFRSGCYQSDCANIMFAGANAASSGSPKFVFDNTASLNILNDGNCCSAAIIFADAGAVGEVTGQSISDGGVKNASGTGDLLIRAHANVTLDADADFDASTKNNNISILSDDAYIKTKAFTHKAAGTTDKGHLTLWAKGPWKPNISSPLCGGAVTIEGNLTTTSTFTGNTGWQNLRNALVVFNSDAMNSENLARSAACTSTSEEISARTAAALNTGVQTRIQSDNDSILVTQNFTHVGQNGGLLIQANRGVAVGGRTNINFRANTGEGDAVIQSRNSSVYFGGSFTYTGHKKTDLFIDGETGVIFNHGGTIDYEQTGNDIEAHTGIQSNAGSIAFRDSAFEFKNHSHGNTQLWAGSHITNTNGAPLIFTFTQTNQDDKQNIDLYAGNAIKMYGNVTFKHDDADNHKGFIKLRANANEAQLWNESPLTDLVKLPGLGNCPRKCVTDSVGDIDLRAKTTILYRGKPTVWMAANNDINIRQDYVHIAGSTSQDDQGPTRIVAGRDIVTGANTQNHPNNYQTTFFYNHVGKGNTGHFDMKAGHDIITNNKVILGYSRHSETVHNTLFACNNIDIRNAFTYGDSVPLGSNKNKWTRLYAGQDILSNRTCLNYGAPVNFYTSDNILTDWNAGRNIITGDSVNFRYGETGNSVRPLFIVAQGGNIEMKRWTNIDYDSKNRILISAERHQNYSEAKRIGRSVTNGPRANGTPTEANRFMTDGMIFFNDSMKITRNNATGGSEDGVTDIYADYHIRTAMMNITNTEATNKNKTTIESHKGDIWLGYSVAPDACQHPNQATVVSYDNNLFHYKDAANTNTQSLKIRAGYQDQANTGRFGGGNIYIAQMKGETTINGTTNTDITIPFSNEYFCGSAWSGGLLHNRRVDTMMMYEHAGIIFGLGHCGKDKDINKYAPAIPGTAQISKRSLTYLGNKGNLTVDAGTRGNIIINRGAYLNFQDPSSTGNATFRTRFGDIDMREPFNVDSMVGSLLFLAQIENINDLSKVKFCGCEEERNNVYLQDFQYRARAASGSVFVGADNNIKLNYGGLQNIGTRHDPFLSKDYTPCPDGGQQKIGYGYNGSTCSDDLHCDADSNVNKARTFLMKFDKDTAGNAITSGGFGAVASDYIDVYRKFEYYGGNGSGMSSVPGTGTLHGENVAGYGLFMKTQANKGNWDYNIFEKTPDCPTPCDGSSCSHDYLHMVSRMTFHDDAYIEAHNQKVMLWSPVVETFGLMTLNTEKDAGGNTEITLKADSLIFHDDFIKKGNHVKLSTWSGLHKDLPIMKFGHMRKTPPFIEAKKSDCQTYTECVPCYRYIRYSKDPLHMLDTITIKFGDGAYLERLNTVVFDHTVLTCLTDSFDHVKGGEVQNAQIFTDTFKIRHQVDLFADEKHERDAHLELISEEQMGSKDYAGIYTKHLHMEPIGACGTPYSELWTSDDLALDVITTSIFGGFGFIHSDVHVENGGHLNAGFTSLRLKGMCYEQMCGTQRMKDLRLDVGAQLHFSVGTSKGLNGEYSDAIEVDRLTTYGSVDVNIEIRPCEKIEKRCYPIIYYKSITPNSLNQLKLNPRKVKIDGEEYPLHLNLGTDGVVYVCVGDAQPVDINRTVTLPSVSGVKTDPVAGIWDVKSRGNFKFKATYSGSKPLAVRTNRTVNGVPELLTGTKNANGEYEYVVPNVQQDITLSIGPDYVSNQLLAGTAVWSHGEMIYIRVDRADIASIYSVAGQLVRKVDLPEGDTSIPMSRGAYVITLKDGSVHKVIVK